MVRQHNFVDPTLPHQLRIFYAKENKLRATCNCKDWEKIFKPEVKGQIEEVISEYKDHVNQNNETTIEGE